MLFEGTLAISCSPPSNEKGVMMQSIVPGRGIDGAEWLVR